MATSCAADPVERTRSRGRRRHAEREWPATAADPAAPGPRRPRRHAQVRLRRRPAGARARHRPRDRHPRRARRGRRRGSSSRRSASGSCRTWSAIGAASVAGGRRAADPRRRRGARRRPGALLRRGRVRGDGRGDRRVPQGRRHPRRRRRGARLRLPPGLGSYVHGDRRLDARLAGALMGIQAIKGVEVGDGFRTAAPARLRRPRRDRSATPTASSAARTNRAGGIEGGMTNGEVLRVRAAMKPISTVPRALATVDVATGEAATRAPPALGRVRRAARRRRRRGDGRARAGRGPAGEVRRRLGGRVRAQPRAYVAAIPALRGTGDATRARASCSSARPGSASRRWGARSPSARRRVRDTDADVEAAAGKAITEIFVDDGEPQFRALERAVVAGARASTTACSRSAAARLDPRHPAAARGPPRRLPRRLLAHAAPRVGLQPVPAAAAGNPRAQWGA